MGDYTEHLISMAGGDGEPDLDQIHGLLGRIAFPETPEERDEAEAALLAVVRSQQAKIERVRSIHRPINVYDECECPDGTHPEEYEWIDCEDYNGCENSFSHYACESCCTANDYITEWCSDAHDHSTETGSQCPTMAALTATEGVA